MMRYLIPHVVSLTFKSILLTNKNPTNFKTLNYCLYYEKDAQKFNLASGDLFL